MLNKRESGAWFGLNCLHIGCEDGGHPVDVHGLLSGVFLQTEEALKSTYVTSEVNFNLTNRFQYLL